MSFDPVSYLMGKKAGGGGSGVTVEPLTATENRTYTAPSGKAYSPVTVAVPVPAKQIATGTFVPASSSEDITVPHDLGVVPDMIIAFNITNANETTNGAFIKVIEYYAPYVRELTNWKVTGLSENAGAVGNRRVQNGATTSENYGDFRSMETATAKYSENVTASQLYFTTNGTAFYWEAGATYRWYAFKFPAS